jgi:hypothetical protein
MVVALQSIILFWRASQCGLDAVWSVKLMLAARWLSSRSVEKGYRELSEGRAHAGQLATPESAAREEPFDCRSEHRGFSEGRLPDDSRYVLQPPGRAPAGPQRFAIQCSRYSAQRARVRFPITTRSHWFTAAIKWVMTRRPAVEAVSNLHSSDTHHKPFFGNRDGAVHAPC